MSNITSLPEAAPVSPGCPTSGVSCGRVLAGAFVVLFLMGCGRDPSQAGSGSEPTRNPALAPLDYLSAQGQGKRRSENVVALAQVQKALQEFQVTENRWPRDLEELVRAGLLATVPSVPVGQRIAYDPATGTVRVVPAAR
ncbi:MAG: hypothetical protein ACO3I0_04810 [Limisphaerales bacterium]